MNPVKRRFRPSTAHPDHTVAMNTAPTATANTTNVTIRRVRASTRQGYARGPAGILVAMTNRVGGDVSALPVVTIGTAVWLVACVVVGLRYGIMPPDQGVWWWGVTVVGTLSGLIGLPLLVKRRRRLERSG